MFVEMTASITPDPSFSINLKVADFVEGSNAPQVTDMCNVLKATLKGFPPRPITCQTTTVPAISAETEKNISDKQIGFLRKLLSEKSISENDFCKEHSVEKLELLPMKEARQIINDLKGSK